MRCDPRVLGWIGAGLVALGANGCMTSLYLATDYDDRTEAQWLRAFAIDMGVGAALIGTSFLVGQGGDPEPWTLSAGVVSAGMAFLILPLATPPPEPTDRR